MLLATVFLTGIVVGYMLAVWGSFLNMNSGKQFWKRDDGSWYPYDPTQKRSK